MLYLILLMLNLLMKRIFQHLQLSQLKTECQEEWGLCMHYKGKVVSGFSKDTQYIK